MPSLSFSHPHSLHFIWHVSTWLPDSLLLAREVKRPSPLRIDTVRVTGRSRKMADTRSRNEESPNDTHPLTSIAEDETSRLLRGKAIEKKTRVKNCLTKRPQKNIWTTSSLLPTLWPPEEKTLLAMKSEATGRCDLDEIGVADNMAIK